MKYFVNLLIASALICATCFTSCKDENEGGDTKIQSVTPTQATLFIPKGSAKTIAATIAPNSADQEIDWTSEDPNIATILTIKVVSGVSASLISGISVGSTNVTATSVSDPSKKATIRVTVTTPIDSMTVDRDKVTFVIGATKTAAIETTVWPTNAIQKVTWTSSNPDVATAANGVITAVAEGSATITATSTDDPTKTVTVAVEAVTLVNKYIHIASKFGNGLTVSWVNLGGDLVEFFYTDDAGQPASTIMQVTTQSSSILDFGSGPLSYRTLYFSKITEGDTLRAPLLNLTGTIYDFTTYVRSSPAETIIKPGDFDIGGEGIGFHDADNNISNINYRRDRGDTWSDAVYIQDENGYFGWMHSNFWVNYTVDVLDAGNYEIDWNVAVNGSGAKCRVEVDDDPSEEYPMINNGNWTDWRYYCERNYITPPVYHLTTGKHTVKFYSMSANYNYNGLKLTYKP
jgi:uncharacterized protein YjdB